VHVRFTQTAAIPRHTGDRSRSKGNVSRDNCAVLRIA
jgi:hypothetical protein